MSTVEVTLSGTGQESSVVVDGVDISHHVTAVTIEQEVGSVPRVHLDLVVHDTVAATMTDVDITALNVVTELLEDAEEEAETWDEFDA